MSIVNYFIDYDQQKNKYFDLIKFGHEITIKRALPKYREQAHYEFVNKNTQNAINKLSRKLGSVKLSNSLGKIVNNNIRTFYYHVEQLTGKDSRKDFVEVFNRLFEGVQDDKKIVLRLLAKYDAILKFWDYKNERNILKDIGRSIVDYIDTSISNQTINANTKSINDSTKLYLSDLFKDDSLYKKLMEILVANGYCNENTFIWKDEKKGNKALVVALIKYLHTQKYYYQNKRPTIIQIREIAKNTFGWEMSIDTIKRAKPEKFNFSFIPIADSLR